MDDKIDPLKKASSGYIQRNREYWDQQSSEYAVMAEKAWMHTDPSWGIYSVPESDVHMFPSELKGLDVVDLGCGTGYVSAWLQRLGASSVGIDNSPKQLATARALQRKHDLPFPLVFGNAETTPLADASFDFAISEYGASIWCDPFKWIPEAARLLRPGGNLHFLVNSALVMLCTPEDADASTPATEKLERPLFGMYRFEWEEDHSVEFHLPHGKMISLLHECGFEVLELIEVEIPDGSSSNYQFVTDEWARKWPAEEIWKARKRP